MGGLHRRDGGTVDVGLLHFQALKVRATASGDAVEKRRPEFLEKFARNGVEADQQLRDGGRSLPPPGVRGSVHNLPGVVIRSTLALAAPVPSPPALSASARTSPGTADAGRGRVGPRGAAGDPAGSGSSPWKLTNWHCTGPMNIGVSVVSNSTSTWQIDYTLNDPSGTFPNPVGTSAITVFSTTSGSSTPTNAAFTTPVAAIRLTMNAQSSAGAR